jgi:catalase
MHDSMSQPGILGIMMSVTLLATLGAAAGEPATPDEMMSFLGQIFAVHPEPLTDSGNFICAAGQFVGTSSGSALSRSALFTQRAVPVVARFSTSSDGRYIQELDLEFRLTGGSVHDMAMLNTPVFATLDPVAFREMVAAFKVDPYTGVPDVQRLQAFVSAHHELFSKENPVVAGHALADFAGSKYFSIHTFRFIDAKARTHFVRWRLVPRAGEKTALQPETAGTNEGAFEEQLIKRLASGPLRWDMIVYVGHPSDTTDNASLAWPENRRHFRAGTLTITRVGPESARECGQIRFDPLVVADGIAPADDPVLPLRSPGYRLAFSRLLAPASAEAALVVTP